MLAGEEEGTMPDNYAMRSTSSLSELASDLEDMQISAQLKGEYHFHELGGR